MTKNIFVGTLAAVAFLATAIVGTIVAEEDSPLGDKMEGMAHKFKAIQKQFSDPAKKESTLALIEKMKKNAIAARECTPPMAMGIPEKDRPQFEKDFKLAIDELIEEIGSLDKAVRDGKLDEAQTIIKDILETKREGHSSFTKKKGKGADHEREQEHEGRD